MFAGYEALEIRQIMTSRYFHPVGIKALNVSKECRKFLENCLELDPKKRPESEDLFLHPWLLKNRKKIRRFSRYLLKTFIQDTDQWDALFDQDCSDSDEASCSSHEPFQRRRDSGETFEFFEFEREILLTEIRAEKVAVEEIEIFYHVPLPETPQLIGEPVERSSLSDCLLALFIRLSLGEFFPLFFLNSKKSVIFLISAIGGCCGGN
jgi:serine/threonine protein kinase